MCDRFEAERTAITRVYHCPYNPLDAIGEYRCDHPWRKPKPGMLLQAASDLKLDPARCAILGDKRSDMEAGAAAGVGLRVLIGPRDAKMGGLPYEVVVSRILAKRSQSFDLAFHRLRLISARGSRTLGDSMLELSVAAVQWRRRAAVCVRPMVLRAA
jgi:histidinol phosphatase-like enzyme